MRVVKRGAGTMPFANKPISFVISTDSGERMNEGMGTGISIPVRAWKISMTAKVCVTRAKSSTTRGTAPAPLAK